MDNKITIPYRTPAGLEIGKFYAPPKGRDIRVDYIDIYDQDRIQMAYITDGKEMRKEKIALLICVLSAIAFVSTLIIFV